MLRSGCVGNPDGRSDGRQVARRECRATATGRGSIYPYSDEDCGTLMVSEMTLSPSKLEIAGFPTRMQVLRFPR